ncbi:MAG: nucleotide exchange factor GrpE [Alphaproteobacteria bacterium]|nr:nucleotide exchange factor GrpE [Alphaproteobacteria bacterium]
MSDDKHSPQEFSLDALSQEMGSIKEFVEQQGRRDEVQQKAFDALYEELRQYKEDFVFQAEKPLLLDLLLFYDSLNWFQQSLVKQEMSPEVISDSFQYLIDEFLELLYRRDVLPMEGKRGFDRESQKAIKVVHTSDEGQDYTIRQVLKRGFTRGGRVLRPEEVVINRYDPGKPEREDS